MIKAASPEVLAIYRDWIARQGLASFSALFRKDLLGLLRSAEAVQLIEAACVIGNFVDPDDHAARDRAVGRLLAKWGVKRPRGKRAPPALLALVDRVAPILVAYGVRPATGDNARMVLILLRVASELGIHGDVRGVLRRTGRTHKDLQRLSRFCKGRRVIARRRSARRVIGHPAIGTSGAVSTRVIRPPRACQWLAPQVA